MANTATITVTTDQASGELSQAFISDNKNLSANTMANYIRSLSGGMREGTLAVKINTGNAVAANGTLTGVSVADGDTAVVNGVTFTAKDLREKTTITAVADSSGSLNNTYFNFGSAGDVTKFYVWYNINSAGVDPAVAGRTGIRVNGATGASASTLGGATRTAIAAATSSVTVSGSTTSIVIQTLTPAVTTATADGTAATGFTIVRTITGAVPSTIQWQIGTDTAAGDNLAAAINAKTTVNPYVSSVNVAGVVTVTAVKEGITGNTITIAGTGGVTSGATRLAGGVNDTSASTYSFGR